MKDLQRQNELKRRNSLVAILVERMRSNGAGERSIQKALPALHELVKFAERAPANLVPDKPENP